MASTQSTLLQEAFDFCLEKLEAIRRLADFPYTTRHGVWQTTAPGDLGFMPAHGSWTVGFTPGMLWLAYRATGRREYAEEALDRCRRLLHRKNDDTTHDLGFIFFPSYAQGFDITGEAWLRDGAVEAARTLARRFNSAGRFLRAWGPIGSDERAGQTTIDAMMNLALLYWAAEAADEPALARVATAHAETTSRTLVRPDGSTYHVYEFNLERGEPIRGFTYQGDADESTWSRGQAWAIYGFARSGRQAGRTDFLRVAERLADYFLDRLPEDRVPYWDFDDLAIPNAVRDSSAGAISAAGILELAANEAEPATADRYRQAALEMLAALYERSSSRGQPQQQGVLLHGTWHKKAGFGLDASLVFGDYYFMKALARALGLTEPHQDDG
jgi:unsaturated chondroitin disaccharide hydrolase